MIIYYKRLFFSFNDQYQDYTDAFQGKTYSFLEIPFLQTQLQEKFNLGILLGTVLDDEGIQSLDYLWKNRLGSPEWILKLPKWEHFEWGGEISDQPNIFIYRGDDIVLQLANCISGMYTPRKLKTMSTYTVPSGLEGEMWMYLKGIIYRSSTAEVAYGFDTEVGDIEIPIRHFRLQFARDILYPDPRLMEKVVGGEYRVSYSSGEEFFSYTNPYILPSYSPQNLPLPLS